jgi:flagellar basal body P-ring formation protein FlgA
MKRSLCVLLRLYGAALLTAVAWAMHTQGVTAQTSGVPPALASSAVPLAAQVSLQEALSNQVKQLAEQTAQTAVSTDPAKPSLIQRIEVQVGQLDPRLRLAPCTTVEPYIPTGARMWGKTRIGLRCIEGAKRWNISMPLTVQVFGQGVVAVGGLPAGHVLTPQDIQLQEVDLAQEPSPPLLKTADITGRTLLRPVQPGQSLRASHLKPRQWFAAGEKVKIRLIGSGFQVTASGDAMNTGWEGQSVRVRMDNGKVVIGKPVGNQEVEVLL